METKMNDKQIERAKRTARRCKLNGYDKRECYEEELWFYDDYEDECDKIWEETDGTPKVGMLATINLYSDRRAAKVVNVISPRKIVVAHLQTRCIDYYGSNYEIIDEIDYIFEDETYTLRKGGTWVAVGQPKKFGSVTLTLGYARNYIDPEF